jgi:hypothetical protein
MPSHETYRELGALAAIGQLSFAENKELEQHLGECDACREAYNGYALVIQNRLPQADSLRWRISSSVPRAASDADIRDRFLARARAEGMEFSAEVERPQRVAVARVWWGWRAAIAAAAAVLLIVLGISLSRGYRLVPRSTVTLGEPNTLTGENSTLHVELAAVREDIKLRTLELERMKREKLVSEESLRELGKQLEESKGRADQLTIQLQQVETKERELASDNQQKDTVIVDLGAKNDKLNRENADNLSTRVILESQVRGLTESLQQETASVERERQLMAVSKDVKQLISARNLHILDVHDVDGGGKSQKSFGRVFYVEGQSLVFYAFDLPSGKLLPAKYSFQAWGQREYAERSIRNLGTFEVDDHEQRRWVLKVTDPALLRDIDSVFVTAEAKDDAKMPQGKKLLYAYIVGQPNHP